MAIIRYVNFSYLGYFIILGLQLLYSNASAQQVNFKNYSVGDGLAQSQVFAIVEDDKGYLWFGTRGGGLSRFDGFQFVNYTTRDGLLNDFVSSLYKSNSGDIFIGTSHGLSIYNGSSFKNYPLKDENGFISISALAADAYGRIWMSTAKGIYYYHNNKVVAYSKINAIPTTVASVLYIDASNAIWYGDDYGLNKIDTLNGKIRRELYRGKDGFTNVLVRVIKPFSKTKLLIGTYGGALFLFDKSTKKANAFTLDMDTRIIHDVVFDRKQNIWIATYSSGVYRFSQRDSSLTHFTEMEGLANNHVSTIYEDRWGNIWIGTSGGGLSRYAGEQFSHYSKKNGLAGDYIYSICKEGDSILWMGTSAKGIVRMNYRNEQYTHFGRDSGFVDEKVKVIVADSNTNLWIGTEGQGLWFKDSLGFKKYSTQDGLSGNWIKDILFDEAGNIWVATAGGGISVLRFKGNNLQVSKIREQDGLAKNRVNCLWKDQQQRIWYGTEGGGIGCIDGEKIKNYSISDGLSSSIIRAIREDANGFLWMATGGGGVCKMDIYRSQSITIYNKDKGLTSDNIYLLELDKQHNFWIGSDQGLDRIILNENSEISEIKHFGKAEGFVGIETCQNAVCKTPDGSIWFGTIAGLTRYNPERSELNTQAPLLHFTTINLFYQPLSKTRFSKYVLPWNTYQGHLEFNHDENHLGFEFIAIDQRNPSSVKYQWKLEGSDQNWSPLSFKHDVTYSNIAPGNYVLHVRAINEDGVESTGVSEFHFKILPAYWQTWWFKVSMVIFIVLVIVFVIYIITRRYRLKNKALREKLRLEKRMVELEQKALRLQMNPHFIFHALNSIQGLIVQKDEQTARKYLSKFSKLMRSILENSREQLISLDKEVKTLSDYLELENFTRNNSFDFEIKIAEHIDAEEIFLPSMLLQPFVENSLIHGFNGLNRRGKISIEFNEDKGILICKLVDNGIGRSAANKFKAQQESEHKSMALIVTQERLALINNQNSNNADEGISIHDTFDEDGKVNGTEVIIRIRLLT